jgi:flagellar biosynthesis protein FlhG
MEDQLRHKLWAIGGGKGGVGKSVVTVLLGTMLARQGKKVVLVDADLGGSNLHTLLGIRYPAQTLADFIQRKVEDIQHVMMDTPVDNLMLICGADDILGLANPKSTQKTRLFNHLKKLDADLILLDLGAGTSFTTIDFFLYAPNKIVVLSPQITSLQNAYGFIKSSLYRKLSRVFRNEPRCLELIRSGQSPDGEEKIDSMYELRDAFWNIGEDKFNLLNDCLAGFSLDIVANMVRESRDGNVGRVLQNVSESYLSLKPEYLGYINYDPLLVKSINKMTTYLSNGYNSTSGSCFYDIAGRMLKRSQEWEAAGKTAGTVCEK